jgi:hypothetical protein
LNQRRGNDLWINPLLTRLNLVGQREQDLARNAHWREIEECEITERIGRLVTEVNRAAGYHVLEMVEFLPPQKNILRVSFERNRAKHRLELAIRDRGIVLMFSSTKGIFTGWRNRLTSRSGRKTSSLAWEEFVEPEEISEQNIQAWLSYLLSGLDKKFRLDQILQASLTPDGEVSESLRKASA